MHEVNNLKYEIDCLYKDYNDLVDKFNSLAKDAMSYAQVLQILKEQGINRIEIPFKRLCEGVEPNLRFEDDVHDFKQIVTW